MLHPRFAGVHVAADDAAVASFLTLGRTPPWQVYTSQLTMLQSKFAFLNSQNLEQMGAVDAENG